RCCRTRLSLRCRTRLRSSRGRLASNDFGFWIAEIQNPKSKIREDMPSTREIRRRISSAKNISQITRAMEMVAAARMRRAQSAVVAGRPYAEKIGDVIENLAASIQGAGEDTHPLLHARPIKNVAVIMITADKGLAGALNTNIIRRTTRFIL